MNTSVETIVVIIKSVHDDFNLLQRQNFELLCTIKHEYYILEGHYKKRFDVMELMLCHYLKYLIILIK